MRIAVVIPVYNEERTLPELMRRIGATPPPTLPGGGACERRVLLCDDGSLDGTGTLIEEYALRPEVLAVPSRVNTGKGGAIRRGFDAALRDGADVILVQDADLEYDPADHAAVLRPILEGWADAVIGSRFLRVGGPVRRFWHAQANRGLTLLSNVFSDLRLTDMECGTKAFTRAVLERMDLRERGFGIEPEMVAKLAKVRLPGEGGRPPRRVRAWEVGVSYEPRGYDEGKKIGWRDGLRAVYCIVKYNLF